MSRYSGLQGMYLLKNAGVLRHVTGLPASDYYDPSAPSLGISWRRAFPPVCPKRTEVEPLGGLPRLRLCHSTGEMPNYAPAIIATATPQAFTVASLLATSTGTGAFSPTRVPVRTATQPGSVKFELMGFLRDVYAGSLRTPSRPARLTRTI